MSHRLSVKQWWVVEYIRCLEERHGRFQDDAVANALAKASHSSLTERIAIRAEALPMAKSGREDLQQLMHILRWLIMVWFLVAVLAGLGAGFMAASEREVEVLVALLTVLALPTLTLMIWSILILLPGHRRSPSRLMSSALDWAIRGVYRSSEQRDQLECVIATAMRLLSTPYGRWGLSSIGHLVWLTYLCSALLFLSVQLMVRQYDLGWGTTLLSEATALQFLMALAWLPELLGWMPAQSELWLAQGQMGVAPEAVRMPWAVFMLSLIVAYGIGPRLLALGLSIWLGCRARQRMHLDLSQPGYARLKRLLLEPQHTYGMTVQRLAPQNRAQRESPVDGRNIYALSLETNAANAIPDMQVHAVTHLGSIEGRKDRSRVLAAFEAQKAPALCLILEVQTRRSPDQGMIELINHLADASGGALLIVLSDFEALQSWEVDEDQRIEEWTRVGLQTGGRLVLPEELKQVLEEVVV